MTSKEKNYNFRLYGARRHADDVWKFLEHVIQTAKGKRTPVCIWGQHGIGKTELVEAFAKENGFQFQYVAPAQFEEMGDILGMPKIIGEETVFVAPEWVPRTTGPGILLLDDVNRADDRILRGIMQLLQNHELISWTLPPDWHIVLTANPDGGDYSVTPMDDAMLTRMMHITMKFDLKTWIKWATKAGIDQRGIAFVNMYPEIIQGGRTTPRTLVQFFESISGIPNLKAQIELVSMLADSCLDESTAASFVAFVQKNLSQLIWPEEILDAPNFEVVEKQFRSSVYEGNQIRIDLLSTICSRLTNFITHQNKEMTKAQRHNLRSFLLLDFLPNDIRLGMLQDMIESGNKSLEPILEHPEIRTLLLDKM